MAVCMALSSAEIMEQLAISIDGMLWISETDAPFEIVNWAVPLTAKLTEKKLLKSLGLAKDLSTTPQDLDTLLQPILEPQDWHGEEEKEIIRRYENLRDFLKQNLTDLQVYRCGEIEITICILGKNPDGKWVGLKTQAVET
jgi:hypothetical protein